MSAPLVVPDLAAMRGHAGSSLGATGWVPITQERIEAFCEAIGDRRWIYCDPERAARESPWKSTIANAYLLLSLVPSLLPRLIEIRGIGAALNTGVDRCRFEAPVTAGSRVRMRARVAKARSVPGNGCLVAFGVEFEAEGGERTPCAARVNYLYYP
jgi:acyl dehydratase